ncbi:MAG: hypothetical protein ACYC4Q_11710 [Victivallaceae bacterium]
MKKLIVCLAAVMISTIIMAETKPVSATETKSFNCSITPDVAIYSRNVTIEGVTLSIWGENPQKSLALGIVNGSVGSSAGLDWAFILNYADNYDGVKWGLVNFTKGNGLGWDAGFVNYTEGLATGLLTGVVNYTERLNGVEFGLINYVDKADAGVQIGILNIIRNNKGWFSDMPNQLAPWMIFVNWRF